MFHAYFLPEFNLRFKDTNPVLFLYCFLLKKERKMLKMTREFIYVDERLGLRSPFPKYVYIRNK